MKILLTALVLLIFAWPNSSYADRSADEIYDENRGVQPRGGSEDYTFEPGDSQVYTDDDDYERERRVEEPRRTKERRYSGNEQRTQEARHNNVHRRRR